MAVTQLPDKTGNGASAEASTMTTNPDPPETDAPPVGRSVPPKDEPQDAKPAGKGRTRGRARAQAKPPKPAAELTQQELAALGLLQVEAARLGQTVEDYVADLRAMIKAHDRLLEVVGGK